MTDKKTAAFTPRSVQSYIDETPVWSDGTTVSFSPMTSMQWRIWALATAGKFFEGMIVFMTGVALPLIVREFSLGAPGKGVVSAAPLLGILVGASALGGLADHFGRKFMFIAELILFTVFLTLIALTPNLSALVMLLFGMGMALGCDYPTAHMVISESIPSRSRGKLVLSAFGFQAVGALAGTALGYIILTCFPSVSAWRLMYACGVIPATLVIVGRFFITQSPHWLIERGEFTRAEREVARLLKRKPPYPRVIHLSLPTASGPTGRKHSHLNDYALLFSRHHRRATILAAVPWFLQDLGTYGIGIFTPTILAAAFGHTSEHPRNLAALISNDMLAAKGAAMLDVLLIIGIITAVLLADRVGRIRLQVAGFIGCAFGLFIASLSVHAAGPLQMLFIFSGFMIFNFMTNAGPNAMTYLLSGEVFPTAIRGKGAGFAASFAKLGAVCTAFLFPILLKQIGIQALLWILAGTSFVGALITWRFRIETTGVNLEEIGTSSPAQRHAP
jgi:MFS family permease